MRPVRAFAGDKGIHPLSGRLLEFGPGAAGTNAYFAALGTTPGQQDRITSQNFTQTAPQGLAAQRRLTLPTDEFPFMPEKWFQAPQPD